ncbi:MAG: RHS repeat protein [Prevotella sp.]|nr:RHS repeat protein [Prevotella sp.]
MNSPDVGYTWVIEESLDSVGTPIGNIRYRFSNYDSDITGNTHLDQGSYYSKNPANDNVPGLSPYTSISFERGKLLSKEYRSANDIVYKKEVYNYSRTGHEPLLTAHQYVVTFGYNPFYSRYQDGCYGWLTYTHTASYLPVSVTETIRSTNGQTVEYRTKTFEYNAHKMLSRETCTMSDGTEEVTTYKYPFDYTSYRWMTDANITAPVIEKKVTAGGLTHTETNEYAGNSNGVPYIQKRTVGTGGSGRTEFEVSRVDSYGNPVEMTVNGISNVLCWGYEGQRLLAHVENATFNKLKYLLNMNPNATTMDYSALVNGRSLLPSALFHLYQYDANLRLQSETTPNGITTFYKYDNFGRLCEIYYIDGVTGNKKLLESYGYHYYNQQQ